MSINTQEIINQLADKLLVPVEHLWGVLVNQAPIAAATIVLQIFIGVVFYVCTYKKLKKMANGDTDGDALILLWIVWGYCALVSAMFVFFCSVPELISAVFNPEYWALKQLLGVTKHV